MNSAQRKLLIELQNKKIDDDQIIHPFNILIHSVLNTVALEKLVTIYLENGFPEIKQSLFSNIEKRVYECVNAENIYEDIKCILENGVDYQKSQRIRKVLEILLSRVPNNYKYDFFNTFFYSIYSNDKKCALKYIDYARKEINDELLSEYLSSANNKYLIPLLNKKNIDLLAKNVQEIWALKPYFFCKKQIIELLSKTKFNQLEFLKEKELDLYLLACLVANKITPKNAVKLLSEIPISKRHFSIFNLSKELRFESIEREIRKYVS